MCRYKNYHQPDQHLKLKRLARKFLKKISFLQPIHEKAILQLPENSYILDIGCGTGRFLQKTLLLRDDLKLYSCDIINVLPSTLSTRTNFIVIDLNMNALPYNDCTFDLIICSHVIEHLTNPLNIFHEIFRILKFGGLFILETPSVLSVFIPSVLPNWFNDSATINFFDDPTHIRPYTRKSLVRMANMANFSQIKVKKSRNILSLLAFAIVLIDIFKRKSSTLAGFIGSILGTVNLLIAKKEKNDQKF
ncbi:MAG: class I SAM-dependent methyltransferase [Candidatus Helarchaeota archaeon]